MSREIKLPGQGTGEQIRISVTEHADAMDGVLQFLAVLAYPDISERHKRDPLAEAFHGALYKARVWTNRTNKHDSVALRTMVPEDYRRKTNRKYQGLINKGMKRINARITAGNIALRFCTHGLGVLRTQLTTSPAEHSFGEWTARYPITILSESGSTPADKLLLVGPQTVRDALRTVVEIRDKKLGVLFYGDNEASGKDDAVENFRKNLWLPSIPVLHLAMALYDELCRFPAVDEITGAQFLWELTQRPLWLREALMRAEGYRNILPSRIPENGFNPRRALRLLPQ